MPKIVISFKDEISGFSEFNSMTAYSPAHLAPCLGKLPCLSTKASAVREVDHKFGKNMIFASSWKLVLVQPVP